MMDMGATLCTRSKPACLLCPLQGDCLAHAEGRETDYPVKAKKQAKPSKFSNALLIESSDHDILWIQRPDNGIWGGLWSLPLQFVEKITGNATGKSEKATGDTLLDVRSDEKVYEVEFTTAEQIISEWLIDNKLVAESVSHTLLDDAPIKHSLTHFHWYLTPQKLTIDAAQMADLNKKLAAADIAFKWLTEQKARDSLGLPRAMMKIIER
jgi:A/G-specific adenine glycosylase